jgi:hypothetical protein
MYELALETNVQVKNSKARGWMPKDVRMDCTKFKNKTK